MVIIREDERLLSGLIINSTRIYPLLECGTVLDHPPPSKTRSKPLMQSGSSYVLLFAISKAGQAADPSVCCGNTELAGRLLSGSHGRGP